MAQYYLAVGNRIKAEKLRDCQSDHLEVAEHEAELELQHRRLQGDEQTIVRVVEASSGLVVYAAGKKKEDLP